MVNTSVVLWNTPHIQIQREQDEKPLFKNEKAEKVSVDKSLVTAIATRVFECYAKHLGKEVDTKVESDPKIKATIFSIIGKK